MRIFERLFRIAIINLMREFNFNTKSSYEKNKYDKNDFNYYYQKYKEYYQKYYGNNSNSKHDYNRYEYYGNKKTNSTMSEEKLKLAQYYANLEVPYGASLEEVKKSWKRLLQKYHPDKHLDEDKKKTATVLTQRLNEAYFAIEKHYKSNKI